MSNLKEPLQTNDDSNLNDVISIIGKQETPFCLEMNNIHMNTTADLIDDDFLNLKEDTTIDEIYLIPESMKKKILNNNKLQQQQQQQQDLTGLIEADTFNKQIYETPPASYRNRSINRKSIQNIHTNNSSINNNSNSIAYNTKSDSKLNNTSPSRIPVFNRPQSRLSFTNYDPRVVASTNTLSAGSNDETIKTTTTKTKTNLNKVSSSASNLAAKNKQISKNEGGGAFKYYTKKNDNNSNNNKLTSNKQTSSSTRPSTTTTTNTNVNLLNYSIDSDESLLLDNLINNPIELKKKLKESKMDKEQLEQLQQNYLHLLEQYAEKENFIDKFRLGYDWTNKNQPKRSSTANLYSQVNRFLFLLIDF